MHAMFEALIVLGCWEQMAEINFQSECKFLLQIGKASLGQIWDEVNVT